MCKGGGVAVIGDINAAYRLNVGGDILVAGWLRQESPIFISELQWMYRCIVRIVESC